MDLKYVRGTVKGKPKTLRVYLLNDLHFGSEAVNYELWERIKEDIRKHRDHARILINGDIIEGATKASKGDIYKQRLTPQEQTEFAVSELLEFRDLIDAVTSGNHDQRIMNETSFDPIKMFCKDLGILDKYLEYEGVVSYSWKKCFYSIQMFHGSGGASSLSAIVNKMKRLRKSNCNVVYMAHHHREVADPFIEYYIDPFNHKLHKRKNWLVCGNTLTNFAEYAKKFGYEEKFASQAVLIMSGNPKERGIEVEWLRSM
ncbi:metallophosphoesterase [Priestia megaterium]|uniref:metallophosphoesterase n=1 Tax=Priestia megaterium TaxID=1404 RepID=UPI00211C7BEE|nr:metallophosphoesterase [Priestia megaterium]